MGSRGPDRIGTRVVRDWSELLDELYADSWNEELRRHRSSFVFRGTGNAHTKLRTSLVQLAGDTGVLEKHLLRNFQKYAHRDVVERDSFWYWLTMAQHHGLPTRLLDWTYSPFVALHFATADLDNFHRDGAIWMANFKSVHEKLPRIFRQALREEGADVFTVEMLARFETLETSLIAGGKKVRTRRETRIRSLAEFDKLARQEFLLFFEPPSIDQRVINQFALFSIMPNAEREIDDWLAQFPPLCRKLIIPAKLKREVRDKLDQANVTERVLFPGLDGLSQWLKRHYTTLP